MKDYFKLIHQMLHDFMCQYIAVTLITSNKKF